MTSVGDWVQVTVNGETVEGAVSDVLPGFEDSYAVSLFDRPETVYRRESEMTPLGSLAAKKVGDVVQVSGLTGTVAEVLAGDLYRVTVQRRITDNLTVESDFIVPRWVLEVP